MRTRNIKINVFLNEEEKQLLREKSSFAKLSQSDFIRKLIYNYSARQMSDEEIYNIINSLANISDNLSSLKRQMDFLRYSNYSNFITEQINE